jgi:hypothetical protein
MDVARAVRGCLAERVRCVTEERLERRVRFRLV